MNAIGVPWIYDTIQNVTAEITEKTYSTVLGLTDSIQTIILSNGDSIVLSKNHGIVKYPAISGTNQYYRLIGLERNIVAGTKIPNFFDFFNYNIGDEFEYDYGKINPGESFDMNDHFIISQKNIFPDSINYTVDGNWYGHYFENGVGVTTYSGLFNRILIYSNSIIQEEIPYVKFGINFYDKLSLELITYDDYQWSPYEASQMDVWDCSFSKTFFNDSINRISKETNISLLFYPYYFDASFNKDLLIEYSDINAQNENHCMITEGMGYNFISIHFFENDVIKNLLFCVLNGDTLVNNLFDNTRDDSDIEIKIFPNPVNDFIYLMGIKGSATITLFNSTNNIVQTDKLFFSSESEQRQINLKPMASGFYFIKIETKEGIYFKKIIRK